MKKLSTLLAFFLFFVSMPTTAKQYTFGVVPQQSPVKLFKKWKPIIDYLSVQTGHKIILKTEKSIAEFEKVLYQGGYDFAYMNPYHYILAHRKQSYQAELRAKRMIRGILVSKSNSLEACLAQKNIKFLFPSPNAFAATLLVKYELLNKYNYNINQLKNFQYVNSHDSVYKGIARGVGDLGGGVQRTLRNFERNSDKEQLTVIYKTQPYPSHPIAFKDTMDKVVEDKIIHALLNMPDHLSKSLSINGMIKISDNEYDKIRDLEKKLAVVERN